MRRAGIISALWLLAAAAAAQNEAPKLYWTSSPSSATQENESWQTASATDILIQAPNPREAALFYVEQLGFEITDHNPKMIALHGKHINLFIEPVVS